MENSAAPAPKVPSFTFIPYVRPNCVSDGTLLWFHRNVAQKYCVNVVARAAKVFNEDKLNDSQNHFGGYYKEIDSHTQLDRETGLEVSRNYYKEFTENLITASSFDFQSFDDKEGNGFKICVYENWRCDIGEPIKEYYTSNQCRKFPPFASYRVVAKGTNCSTLSDPDRSTL